MVTGSLSLVTYTMAKDYYDILGVAKSANSDEVKRAYRKLAHQHHPDKGQGNAEKFKEINEAYQVLSNAEKRTQYDKFGQTYEDAARNGAPSPGGFGGGAGNPFGGFDFRGGFGQGVEFDLGDIFGDIFGMNREPSARQKRGIDLEMPLSLTFEEAVFGVEKTITLEKKDMCETCNGQGNKPGTKIVTCPKCHGQGQIRITKRTILGTMQSAMNCDRCNGDGKIPEDPCETCKGTGEHRRSKTLQIKIPAGIDNGQRMRINGEGEVGYKGSNFGDLYLAIRVHPHKEFNRDGHKLLKNMPISFTQAALGASIFVQTLDGAVELKVPSGTQSGKVFKVPHKGVPVINSGKRGDLLITVRVIVPAKLTKKETEILKELATLEGETVEVSDSLWQSIKNNFS